MAAKARRFDSRESRPHRRRDVILTDGHGKATVGRQSQFAYPAGAVDERRFKFLVQQTPYFALEVMQIMADRLRRWA